MLIDITLKITPELMQEAQINEKRAFYGHLGTHFDVMNKEFPLAYTTRKGIVFDISNVKDREISIDDIDLNKVHENMFVAFYSGFIEEVGYGNHVYFKEHPELSHELIKALISKNISIIGVDFAGVRRGKEHPQADQYCADHNVFVIENLCNLKQLVDINKEYVIHTYPLNYTGVTGLPSRVIAEI